jgi:DNA (cytosine-5)-methyltransferase 1
MQFISCLNQGRACLLSELMRALLLPSGGLPDSCILPQNYNEGYHLVGDGVVVLVVRFLSEQLLEPLLSFRKTKKRQA